MGWRREDWQHTPDDDPYAGRKPGVSGALQAWAMLFVILGVLVVIFVLVS